MPHSPAPQPRWPEPVPLAGGFSGETFLAGDGGDAVVVRIYAGRSLSRGERAVEVDAAVLRLMRGIVPVPRVLEVRRAFADHPALLVTERLPGERADLVLPGLDEERLRLLGRRLGETLHRLSHIPTLQEGLFTDGGLRIEPYPAAAAGGLSGWVAGHRDDLGRGGWSRAELADLAVVASEAHDRVAAVGRSSFVHSDFNPKNLLVDPDTLELTGVLDWEFAHSGSPYADLGNLLRFERNPVFVAAVLEGYDGPPDSLDLARSADLWALVELAARADPAQTRTQPVPHAANRLLRAVASSGDVHAVP